MALALPLLANAGFPAARFPPGDVIFEEGDEGDKMSAIRSGEVVIAKGAKRSRRCRHQAVFSARGR
jgi:CRP-like cAMP-binding protein